MRTKYFARAVGCFLLGGSGFAWWLEVSKPPELFIDLALIGWITLFIAASVYFVFGLLENRTSSEISDRATIPAYEAIHALFAVRPNSDETTALNLADAARLGQVRAWGRPIPKMALPGHVAAVEQIPPDIWAYAVIDTHLIHGPMPQSKMKYRQQFTKPYIEDDRTLYDAVRFNRQEIMDLCRAESS